MLKRGNPHRRKKGQKPAYTLSELWVRSGGMCHYCKCGTVLGGDGSTAATRDHVKPKARGGRQSGNLVLACKGCNMDKGSMTEAEFIRYRLK